MIIKYQFILLTIIIISSCSGINIKFKEEGVSAELAQFRKANYNNVIYDLSFTIPEDKQADIQAITKIHLTLKKRTPLIIDFTGSNDNVQEVTVNKKNIEYTIENQHIIIPEKYTTKGANTISVKFIADNQSLNRRDDFVYTLLVPDRARTLFPCFDQPNLKAGFNLTLDVPKEWEVISNGNRFVTTIQRGRNETRFRCTEPISTYLFSFVAGKFDMIDDKKHGREITLYHRETDPYKISQCCDIIDEVFHSLEWMEEYTDIDYPFSKYDLIILPGFQYGGMEHVGATLYNDKRMFLEKNATSADSLGRSNLIAHETAHMWFGDYVTMEWFNDVWNKEVFANWFAAQIVSPLYPDINHNLNFIMSYYPSAYSEDRTSGAMPIQQPLDNLRNAGLIYSNIVYNKSPIVMEMLIKKIGQDNFRDAIREYLKKYAYGNSDWDELIKILNDKTQENLIEWSNTWVKEKGMPTITFEYDGNKVIITQSDPWQLNRFWPMDFTFDTYSDSGKTNNKTPFSNENSDYSGKKSFDSLDYKTYRVQMTESNKTQAISIPDKDFHIMPNSDCKGYGYFKTDRKSIEYQLKKWGNITDPILRFSTLMNLYENVMHLDIAPEAFLQSIINNLETEANPQIFRQALIYAERCAEIFIKPENELRVGFEDFLFRIAETHANESYRTLAMKSFYRVASSDTSLERLYRIWDRTSNSNSKTISESDMIEISYLLAAFHPEKANDILQKQLSRITNPDRLKEYKFVSRALAPTTQQRKDFFNSLLLSENRAIEPWAQTALKWLNHPVRYPESLEYIRPALDILQDIQREGDIFFPANWCSALFSGHISSEAQDIVDKFFADNPSYPMLLESKIRLRADHLYLIHVNSSP